MEEEHLKHIQLVFEIFWEAGIKLKMSKCKFFKSDKEYLGHLGSGKRDLPYETKGENYYRCSTHN